jgi:hypothetical protein
MPETDFDMLYALIMSNELGNTIWSNNERIYLLHTKKLLEQKYGANDFRTRYLKKCIILTETSELDIQDREWVRYILHQESEPDIQHENLLEDLKERMNK